MKKLTTNDLALFLGCQVEYTNSKFNNAPERTELNTLMLDWFTSNPYITSVKPILRPLSDIKKEEAQQVGTTPNGLNRDLQTFKACGIMWMPEDFFYLLSCNFDLFNWIEQGLAIDATKVQEVKP